VFSHLERIGECPWFKEQVGDIIDVFVRKVRERSEMEMKFVVVVVVVVRNKEVWSCRILSFWG